MRFIGITEVAGGLGLILPGGAVDLVTPGSTHG